MSYTPNKTWKSGDPVPTAVEMNHIEQGVQSINMSYTPKTWVKGNKILASDMNHIEQGIADAEGNTNNIVVFNGTMSNPFGTMGQTEYDALIQDIMNHNATVTLDVDTGILGFGTVHFFCDDEANELTFVRGTISADDCTIATVHYYGNMALGGAYMLLSYGDTIQDLTDAGDMFTTVLTIYNHPMPSTT